MLLWLEGARHDEGEMLQRFRYTPGGQVSGRPRETRPASTGGTGRTTGSKHTRWRHVITTGKPETSNRYKMLNELL